MSETTEINRVDPWEHFDIWYNSIVKIGWGGYPGVPPEPTKDPNSSATCPHLVCVAGEEIEAAVECYRGGSWDDFFKRMAKKGYVIMKVKA